MSEEEFVVNNEEPEVECAMCGRNGTPPSGCGICHGSAQVRPRQYTLSERRARRDLDPPRYGPDGAVGPKTSDPLWAGTE